ncbi:MAG: GNAT family protein [Chloroflexota bacterium]
MNIESGKFKIRNATEEDAKILSAWWNDGTIMAHAGFPDGIGTSAKKVAEMIKEDSDLNQRLMLEFDSLPIGEMNYRTTEDKVAEIGIKICNSKMQNRGYGTAYIEMLINHIFMKLNYDKIILDTNLKNERAQHVYEKLGFIKVRTNINSWKNQIGELQSSIDYELSKGEYLKLLR